MPSFASADCHVPPQGSNSETLPPRSRRHSGHGTGDPHCLRDKGSKGSRNEKARFRLRRPDAIAPFLSGSIGNKCGREGILLPERSVFAKFPHSIPPLHGESWKIVESVLHNPSQMFSSIHKCFWTDDNAAN